MMTIAAGSIGFSPPKTIIPLHDTRVNVSGVETFDHDYDKRLPVRSLSQGSFLPFSGS